MAASISAQRRCLGPFLASGPRRPLLPDWCTRGRGPVEPRSFAGLLAEMTRRGGRVRDVAEGIGRRLALPVEAVPEEAFGPLGPIFATDQPSPGTHDKLHGQVVGQVTTHAWRTATPWAHEDPR